jgi:WD40 repeat protein
MIFVQHRLEDSSFFTPNDNIVMMSIVIACLCIGNLFADTPKNNTPAAIFAYELNAVGPNNREAQESSYIPFTMDYSCDGSMLAAGGIGTAGNNSCGMINIWNMSNRKIKTTIKVSDEYGVVSHLIFLPNNNGLISGCCVYNENDTINSIVQLWDINTGREKHRISFENKNIISIALLKESKQLMVALASPSQPCTIRFYDTTEWTTHNGILKNISISHLAMTPDCKFLLSSGEDKIIRVWDISTWQPVLQYNVDSPCSIISVSPGKSEPIAAISTGQHQNDVTIWNYRTGNPIRTIKGDAFSVIAMKFSTDGKMLLIGRGDYIATGEPEHSSPDVKVENKTLASLWDVQSGEIIYSVSGDSGECRGMAFSPSEPIFCTSCTDSSTIQLWKSSK